MLPLADGYYIKDTAETVSTQPPVAFAGTTQPIRLRHSEGVSAITVPAWPWLARTCGQLFRTCTLVQACFRKRSRYHALRQAPKQIKIVAGT
jgi:hypothetical protein